MHGHYFDIKEQICNYKVDITGRACIIEFYNTWLRLFDKTDFKPYYLFITDDTKRFETITLENGISYLIVPKHLILSEPLPNECQTITCCDGTHVMPLGNLYILQEQDMILIKMFDEGN